MCSGLRSRAVWKTGHDLDCALADTMNDPIAAEDDLAQRWILEFGNTAAGQRMVHEPLGRFEGTIDEHRSGDVAVALNLSAYFLDVLQRLVRPGDPHHRPNRRFASS